MQSALLSPWFLGLAIAVALAAGIAGSFALMKGITLAGDVISHIALPGIGLALLLRVHPLIGGGATLLLGTLLIARLEAPSAPYARASSDPDLGRRYRNMRQHIPHDPR
jgi:ABC-type Mn2+/Zn2+ transport system permease subunit